LHRARSRSPAGGHIRSAGAKEAIVTNIWPRRPNIWSHRAGDVSAPLSAAALGQLKQKQKPESKFGGLQE